MKKPAAVIIGFLAIVAFGACRASNAKPNVPNTIQPAETAFVVPASTHPFVPTVDPLTPSAIAQFFHTQEATTFTPEAISTPSYAECSQWDMLTKDRNWALCDPSIDPITFINKSNQLWQFSYEAHYGKKILNPCTQLLYSTNDGKYLYFSLDDECIRSEPGFVFSIGIFRINLTNGDISEILKASYDFTTNDGNYYSVSFSPTGRRLAYIYPQKSPLALTILDLQTGESHSFSLDEKYRYGGLFKWSDDGTKLAFILENESNGDYFISMDFLDISRDNSLVTFINDRYPSWISSHLEVMDNGIKVIPIDDTPLFYDIQTGILSPANK